MRTITAFCFANEPQATIDLVVMQTDAEDPVTLGSNIIYTIQLNNNGPSAATNVVLTDNLPTSVTFQSISAPDEWPCTTPKADTAGAISCSKPNMQPQESVTLTLTVKAASAGVITNIVTATATEPDWNPADNTKSEETTVLAAPTPKN
jgi:uncharacterized repeat protein (TIGR01451 family)